MMILLKYFLEAFLSVLATLFAGVLLGSVFLYSCRETVRAFGRLARKDVLLSVLLGAMVIVGVLTGFSKTNGTNRAYAPMHVARRLLVEDSDVARISEITTQSAGVGVVLHRPSSRANIAEEVVLCGSTNLVTETWETVANIQFPLGVTDVPYSVSRATLDIHGAGSAFFLAFASAGDSDGDGLMDWDEWFNFKTESDDPYSAVASLQERLSTAIPYPNVYPDGLAVKFGGHSPDEFLDDGFTVFEHVFYTGRWNGAMDYSPVAGEGDCLLMVAIDCPAVDEWATLVVGNQRFPLRPGWTETVQLAVPGGEWFDMRIEKGDGWNLASVQPSASILDSDAFLVGAPSSDAAVAEPIRYYAIPLQGRTVCLHDLTATEHRHSFAAPGLEGLAAAVQVVDSVDDLTFTAIDGEDAACTVHAAFPVWERRRIRVFFSHADLFAGPQSAEMDVHFCGRGTSEGCPCCDDNVQSSSCACTEGMSAFDVDGDGLANEVDPEPYVAGPDAHGTNIEWYNNVCSNVFVATEGADGIELSPRHDGVNTNAYYFVEVVASAGPAPVYFNADRDSRLGSPVVVARGGETNVVPLLMGVDYTVTSTVPFSVSARHADYTEISTINGNHRSIKWPLFFEFFESETVQGRCYSVEVVPYDPHGEFAWGDSSGRTSFMSASHRSSCSCVFGVGNMVLFSCSDVCSCGGNCAATGQYQFESAVFSLTGGVCRCGFEDPPYEEQPHHDPLDGPSFSISFSHSAVLFEETYRDYPGDFKPRSSTRVRLTISAYGGLNGGRFTIATSNLEKIVPVACGPMVIPPSVDLNAGESYYVSFLCEAQEASDSANDVEVSGEFVESGANETIRTTAALTVVGIEVRSTVNPPDDDYGYLHRHSFGVGEQVLLRQSPSTPTVFWNPVGGGSNTTEDASSRYFCPLFGCESPVRAECGGAVYSPNLSIIEPTSVKADLLYGRTWDSVRTYSVANGQAGGIGMMLRLYVRPFSVSFTGIKIEEVPQLTYRASGYFDNLYYNGAFAHTVQAGAGNWLKVADDNSFADDQAAFTQAIPWLTPQGVVSCDPVYAWTAGYVYIDNPFGWGQINSQNGDPPYKMFATDTEDEIMLDESGTVGVRKLFNQVTRTTNGVIRLNGELMR